MKNQKLRSMQRACLPVAIVSSLLLLYGCSSDSGTAQENNQYELKNLPKRISPDMPTQVLKGEGGGTQDQTRKITNQQLNKTLPRGIRNAMETKSLGWLEMNVELHMLNLMQVLAKSNATFIDVALDDILKQCAQTLINCSIPSDTIRVKMTPDVINRLTDLHVEWAKSLSALFAEEEEFQSTLEQDIVQGIEDQLNALQGTEIVFGETSYSRLSGAPYDHVISTELKREADYENDFFYVDWQDEKFIARWREDGAVAKFRTSAKDRPTHEYFYQNGAPGEIAIAHLIEDTEDENLPGFSVKVIGTESTNAGILLEMVSSSYFYEAVSLTDEEAIVITTDEPIEEYPDDIPMPDSVPPPVEEGDVPYPYDGETSTDEEVIEVDDYEFQVEVEEGDMEELTYDWESLEPSGHTYGHSQGKMDNDGGYVTYAERSLSLEDSSVLLSRYEHRDSFDASGNLLAGEACFSDVYFTEGAVECAGDNFESYGPEGSSIVDSAHYFAPEDFDSLAASQDAIRWTVQGLPTDIKSIAVISANDVSKLVESEILCRGSQFVSGQVRSFCSATDEQLANTVVVELSKGVPISLLGW